MNFRSALTKITLFAGAVLALLLAACAAPAAPDEQPAATLEPTPTTEPVGVDAPIPVENLGLTFAFIGRDGNLWLSEPAGGPARQITTDAAPMDGEGEAVSYHFPKISFDGLYIAARRDAGTPIPEGYRYSFALMVYDTQTGEARTIFEDLDTPPAGADWKPGTHLLAYGLGADPNYFLGRGQPNPDLATGIFFTDLDSGDAGMLVNPERGITLIQPSWSPDGRYLGFDEVLYMEGRGPFAYYDFEAGKYEYWGKPLGNYDFSPDGSALAYDYLSYTAQGTERIFTRARVDGAEQMVSANFEVGYAYYPAFSPDGSQVAYLVNPGGLDNVQHTLVVKDLVSGETRELGTFESPWYLEWSSDGRALVLGVAWDTQMIYGVDLASGEATALAEGSQPTLARP